MKINSDSKIEKLVADETRVVISAPYLDLSDKSAPVLVATNGKVLAVVPVIPDTSDTQGYISVDAIKSSRTRENNNEILVNGTQKLKSCEMPRPDLGVFPNWRPLLESKKPVVVTITIDAALLSALAKAVSSSGVVELQIREESDPVHVRGDIGTGLLCQVKGDK